jgi:hypothetical protein
MKLTPATTAYIPLGAVLLRLLWDPNFVLCLSFIFALALFAFAHYLEHQKDERYQDVKKQIAEIKDRLSLLNLGGMRK